MSRPNSILIQNILHSMCFDAVPQYMIGRWKYGVSHMLIEKASHVTQSSLVVCQPIIFRQKDTSLNLERVE